MALFKAIAKGYYGDVIHDPDNDRNVYFEAPDDFQCSWAVKAEGETPAKVSPPPIKDETIEAEAILEAEADAGIPDIPEDANEAAGVETL